MGKFKHKNWSAKAKGLTTHCDRKKRGAETTFKNGRNRKAIRVGKN